MKGMKRIAQSAAVSCMAFVLAIGAVTGTEKTSENEETAQNRNAEDTGAAGIAGVLNEYRMTLEEEAELYISVESKQIDVVAASAQGTEEEPENTEEAGEPEEPTVVPEIDVEEAAEPELTAEEKEWLNYLMADVEENLNVRSEASEDSEIVGRLYKGDRAVILEKGDNWIKISSGNVEGYVKSKYCVTGVDALNYAKANCDTIATVTTSKNLRVRREPSTSSSVVKTVSKGDVLTVNTEAETKEGWVAVLVGDTTCYVCADYVNVSLKIGTAVTLAEEKAAEEAAKAKEEKAKEEAKAAQTVTTEKKSAVSATTDEVTLLAALIQCEAGGESYECQVGVGAVVINRIKSGQFPNNMYDVIYQSHQFGPAMTGKLDRRLANGVSSTSIRAAEDALSGTDNTGGCLYFNSSSCGHSGLTIGRMVFW